MLSVDRHWSWTLVSASLAVALAALGLVLPSLAVAAPAWIATAMLAASLACTALAFGRLAYRLRKLELENEGLIEEVSQEFDRVKDKIDIFSEALSAPRSVTPDEVENVPLRRVTIK